MHQTKGDARDLATAETQPAVSASVFAAPAYAGYWVDCPECGLASDLSVLAQRRWDKPWYRAPGFNRMTLPVAWLLLGGIGVLVGWHPLGDALGLDPGMRWLAMFGLVALLLAGWVLLLSLVYSRCGGVVGMLFSLLAHLVLAGYFGGLVLVVASIGVIISQAGGRQGGGLGVFVGVAMLVAGIALFVIGRVCEKQVAGHCIRLYLRRETG